MTSKLENDPFFDSDGDQEKEEPFTLKGEYHRGVTPPSQIPNSPQNDKPHSGDTKARHTSPLYSRSSTSGNYTAESDTMSRRRDSSGSYDRSRSRSRSPAYTKSRSRTPDYSDSFDSEDSMQDSRRASPIRNRKSTRRSTASTDRYSSGTSKDSRSTYRTYGSRYTTRTTKPSVKKGAPKKKGVGRSQSVTTLQQSPRSTEVSRRMLSAKGHTINKLRSEVDELRRKYDDAIRENKLMKQLQRRQEAALAKFEDKDEELPQLLRSHAAEVDNLRERLRRTQDREKDKDRRLKDKHEELNKLNDELKKLRHLADNKRLLERDKLQRKVDRLQDNLDEKERRVNELEKHIENMKKNARHDSEQWKQHEREYRGRVSYLEEENQTIKLQLKEKEKELDIRNIYSNRVMKPPAKLNNTLDSTPRPLAQTRATSNDDIKSTKPAPTIKRSSSAEEKRKTDLTPRAPKPVVKPEEKKVTPRKEKEEKKKELSEHEKILMDLDGGFKPVPPPRKEDDDILKDLDNEIKKRERLDEEKMRTEERIKREKEEQEKRRRAEEEERKRRLEQEEEEKRRKEEEERKGRLSFFSDPKNPYQSSRSNAESSAYEPYFPSNTRNTSKTSKGPVSKSFKETDSYKPSFANSPKALASNSPRETDTNKTSFLNSSTSETPKATVRNSFKETDSYKPSFLPVTSTKRAEDEKEEGFGSGRVGRFGRREEKRPFWLRNDKEDSPQRSRDISVERERKQKEEAPLKSSTFITDNNFSTPKTPIFDDASSEEDNIPFFGSNPKNPPPPSKPSNSIAAVNSVRDLHKYSSNVRQNSGGSKPDARESGDNHEKRREEEELVAQRRKQKEDSERLAEERRKKDILLAKMREIDSKPESRGSKKEYKFTQPIENLHNGKPSHPDVLGSPSSSPKKKPAAESDTSFGGYAPSFGRRAAAGDKPPVKKGGLFDDDDDSDDFFSTPKPKAADKSKDMSNLFADNNKSSTPNKGRNSFEGSVFSTSTKAKPVADSTTLPWEKKTPPGNLFSQPHKPNGLTVNVPKSSFDDFDDDIEEVIL